MVYYLDLFLAAYVLATGMAAAFIVSELARLLGWRGPAGGGRAAVTAANWLVVVFAGPRILFANAIGGWRAGEVETGLMALVVPVVLGWCALIGVVVLQAAFASGFFLA